MSGSLRKRGTDSWQVRVSLGERDPATGRYRYVVRQVRGTKRDAQRVADALASEVARGAHRQSGKRTVAELLEEWMVHLEGQGRAASTLVRYRSAINANIVPRLGNVDITKLEPAQTRRASPCRSPVPPCPPAPPAPPVAPTRTRPPPRPPRLPPEPLPCTSLRCLTRLAFRSERSRAVTPPVPQAWPRA